MVKTIYDKFLFGRRIDIVTHLKQRLLYARIRVNYLAARARRATIEEEGEASQ